MSLVDELERLKELRESGALTEAEFEVAKRKMLSREDDGGPVDREIGDYMDQDSSLGTAANRYVTFRIVMGVLSAILALFFLLFVLRMISAPWGPR